MQGSGDGGNGIKYIGQHVFDFVSSFRNNVNIGTDAINADLFLNNLQIYLLVEKYLLLTLAIR